MTKLTKDILLKKGLPRSNHLKNVKTLNLSKMHLETKDIDSQLFSQMVNLEVLDISQNNLTDLPGRLSLPKLKVVNLSDNQVEDVTVLQQFPNLEEVMYEENLYLTVSDNYKVCCLLPKLRRLNNKDITSLANHVRFVNHRELSSRVASYWEKNYKDKMPDEPTPAMIKSISKEFLKSVGKHVKYGPNSLKDFTKWKVQIIADDLISSLLGEEKRHSAPQSEKASSISDGKEAPVTPSKKQTQGESDSDVRSPSKRLRSNTETNCGATSQSKRLGSSAGADCEVASPTKRLRSSEVLTIVLSPKRSSKSQEGPCKSTSVMGTMLTPTKLSVRSTPSKQTVDRTVTSGKEKNTSKNKQFNLEPLHFLQSHSKDNERDDFRTQLWSCAFEPNLDSSSSKVIATSGGASVCVIDCETGKVLKKYKVPGEEFFTLAWTTLTMICKEGQKRKINILAAGGRFGVVKLMEPKVGLCYGEIKAHKKAISTLCFSPTQDTFLFTGRADASISPPCSWKDGVRASPGPCSRPKKVSSAVVCSGGATDACCDGLILRGPILRAAGSYDKRIILWDIGVPDHEYNFRASQLLTLDTTSTPLRLSPVPASPDQYLMAACEDGCFVWDITLKKQQGKRSYEVEFTFPIYNKESKDSDFHLVDGLAFLSDDLVVSKSVMQGSMYIWSWKKSFQRPKSKSSRKAQAHIVAELKWSETELPYLAPTTSIDGHCVMCGDDAGKIWIYDLQSSMAELDKGIPCKTLKEPTKIIDWPYPIARQEKVTESVINTVIVDPGMEYLVALTDKNIIAIWKIL
ncbi:leucine-rich repeat and WD repeat-containing protein 1 isoform 1-T2 [Anomaloglossus baeobatrachus]|uniref:leucine-rich repeat and WD repeat-containing protein 1 isoform X1 n=1 Tax=Anomaloglossus baeobatrachus TaxID=238106 RepID=UPI003F50712B